MNKGYRMLFLVVGLMLLPVVLATALYFGGWQPPMARPNGELLDPPHALPFAFTTSSGEKLSAKALQGQWHLVVAGAGACDAACLQLLDESRRIHVALYKQMSRVSRLLLGDDIDILRKDSQRLTQLQPDLIIAGIPREGYKEFDMASPGHRIYLMDPDGRLVMRYPADAPPKGILKDMERLLRFS
ncbi:MAG: hypothetical protein EKK46_08665 [Rhodocyclaceae bacterium]|nr:MAG: hypothetical protein EKK46_08665 [Rhodocyclaceae bacterium]